MGISQVDKHTSCLLGCWMEVGRLVSLLACLWGTQLSGISGVSLVTSVSPVMRAPWAGLEGSLLMRGASGLPIEGLEKEEDGPKWRLV